MSVADKIKMSNSRSVRKKVSGRFPIALRPQVGERLRARKYPKRREVDVCGGRSYSVGRRYVKWNSDRRNAHFPVLRTAVRTTRWGDASNVRQYCELGWRSERRERSKRACEAGNWAVDSSPLAASRVPAKPQAAKSPQLTSRSSTRRSRRPRCPCPSACPWRSCSSPSPRDRRTG